MTLCLMLFLGLRVEAWADWTRFRGANGSGMASDGQSVPTSWSDTEQLKWKLDLPGPGGSSPIVSGDRVWVTYWTGYGDTGPGAGEMSDLSLHLLCVDRKTGKPIWDRAVPAQLPETEHGGMLAQHGYASHTPVTDGERVYAFFGKSGVHAFDLDGNVLWERQVGDGLDDRKWGSSASPILAGDVLVVTASPESGAVYGLDKVTGAVVWTYDSGDLKHIWATPVVVGDTVVLSAAKRVVALNASTGKEAWSAKGLNSDAITGSLVVGDGTIFAMGARGAGSIALRPEGDQVVEVWTGRDGANILSPVYSEGHLYWVSDTLANCIDASTGEEVYSERIPRAETPASAEGAGEDRGARFASMDYASPVAADGLLYHTRRRGEVMVIRLQPEFEIVARNQFKSDNTDFIATPAISDGELYLRSMKALYCVAQP